MPKNAQAKILKVICPGILCRNILNISRIETTQWPTVPKTNKQQINNSSIANNMSLGHVQSSDEGLRTGFTLTD